MHSVLHDWPDTTCRQILTNLLPALQPGYSKLLINENVIPDTGAYWETTSLDLIMMAIGSGERTERRWRALLGSVGLQVLRVWTAPVQKGVESLIECEVAWGLLFWFLGFVGFVFLFGCWVKYGILILLCPNHIQSISSLIFQICVT